jgi:hypothetical protein
VEGQFRSDVARLPIRRAKEHYQPRLHEILLHHYWNQILWQCGQVSNQPQEAKERDRRTCFTRNLHACRKRFILCCAQEDEWTTSRPRILLVDLEIVKDSEEKSERESYIMTRQLCPNSHTSKEATLQYQSHISDHHCTKRKSAEMKLPSRPIGPSGKRKRPDIFSGLPILELELGIGRAKDSHIDGWS